MLRIINAAARRGFEIRSSAVACAAAELHGDWVLHHREASGIGFSISPVASVLGSSSVGVFCGLRSRPPG